MNIDDFWCRAFLAAMGRGAGDGVCVQRANEATRAANREKRLEQRPDGKRRWDDVNEPLGEEAPKESADAAPPGMSDAEVAAEFYGRFGPVQAILGRWRGPCAAADVSDQGEWCSEATPSGEDSERHGSGEPGFVAAVERARELVRTGGA